MKSALLGLKESRDEMSATERSVADYLLCHQGEAMGLSIHQLAERTFTSPSTVIRMCQRMGFKGYKEFRQAVTCEVAVRRLNQGEERREITRSDSLDDIVDKITYQNIMSLEDTKSLIDVGTLRACVDLMRGARTVLLFGVGAPLCAAQDLDLRLLRLNKPCVVSDGWPAQLRQAKSACEEDLAIVLSDSGETAEVVECVKALREKRAPIIAITQRAESTVSELSDYQLYTGGRDTAAGGAIGTHISQLNVVDILFTAYANGGSEPRLNERPRPRAAAACKLGTA